jgi:hypothetical protein
MRTIETVHIQQAVIGATPNCWSNDTRMKTTVAALSTRNASDLAALSAPKVSGV